MTWDGSMMGWGGGWGGGSMYCIGPLLWLVLLVAVIVLVARWLMDCSRSPSRPGEDRALDILKERYARGEIDKADFDARKRDIG